MPITYERAYGGTSFARTGDMQPETQAEDNPIGCGLIIAAGAPVQNVSYPGDSARVAGLSALPSHWQPRRRLAGTHDQAWAETRRPLVPEDFQDDHFYTAPLDQRVPGYLRGGEDVILGNLTPEGRTSFKLPSVRLGFRTLINDEPITHRADLHTIILEPTHRRLIMVWHTALPCHHTLYTLKHTRVIDKEWIMPSAPEKAAGRA